VITKVTTIAKTAKVVWHIAAFRGVAACAAASVRLKCDSQDLTLRTTLSDEVEHLTCEVA
jgi:hypothetical protein